MQTITVRKLKQVIKTVEVDRPNDRRVLAEIARFSLNEEGAFPSYKTLAKRLNLGESTVFQAIYRLRDRGLLAVEHRFREDGSQTSNVYMLQLPEGSWLKTPSSRPLKSRDLTTRSNPSLSGMRARGARRNIETVIVGSLEPDAPDPTPTRRYKVTSGNQDVAARDVSERGPVWKPTRKDIETNRQRVKQAQLQEQTPVSEWGAKDLAHAWRRRAQEVGKRDKDSAAALVTHFSNLLADGVTPEEIDGISEEFFADPRNWQGLPGTVVYRKFLANRGAYVMKRRNPQNIHLLPQFPKRPDGSSIFGDEIWIPRSMREAQ